MLFCVTRIDVPVRVSGKVSIDVNGISMPESDLQAYVATMDGRVYMAISDVPSNLGFELQYLTVFPSVVAWLFSLHSENAYNGYQLTGRCAILNRILDYYNIYSYTYKKTKVDFDKLCCK